MNMLLIGIGFFIIQKYVTGYGASASAGYGIALRIEQIILLPAIGLNTAMLSMTGQNYGAKNFDRIYEAFVTCLLYTSPSPRDRTRSRMPSSA